MEVIGIASSTLSGLTATFRLVEIGFQIQGVREDAQTFICLVKQIEDDLEHATACRIDVAEALRCYPDHYRKWIVEAIRRTITLLDDFGQFVLNGADPLSLEKRVTYLLRNYQKLVDREKALNFAHTTLLAAISFMHQVQTMEMGMGIGSPARLKAPGSPSPWNSTTDLQRASSQRPRPQSPISMPPTPDVTPPASQPSQYGWERTSFSAPNRAPDLAPAREVLSTLQQLREKHTVQAKVKFN